MSGQGWSLPGLAVAPPRAGREPCPEDLFNAVSKSCAA